MIMEMDEKELKKMRDNWLKGERILFKKLNHFFIPAQCVICKDIFEPEEFAYLLDKEDNNSLVCDKCIKKANKIIWIGGESKTWKEEWAKYEIKKGTEMKRSENEIPDEIPF